MNMRGIVYIGLPLSLSKLTFDRSRKLIVAGKRKKGWEEKISIHK